MKAFPFPQGAIPAADEGCNLIERQDCQLTGSRNELIKAGDQIILSASVCQPLQSISYFRNRHGSRGHWRIAKPQHPSAEGWVRSRSHQL